MSKRTREAFQASIHDVILQDQMTGQKVEDRGEDQIWDEGGAGEGQGRLKC